MSESFLRCLLHQLPLPLGSRTFRPPRCLVFRDRQFFGGSSFSSSSSSSEPTSRERGVGIIRVVMAGGDAALLFLFFFCSAAFAAEVAVATAEADFFATVDLVLHRDFATLAAGSTPASTSVSLSASTDKSDS
jgi:hypothetical protein